MIKFKHAIVKLVAEKLLRYFSAMPAEEFIKNSEIHKILIKVASTPIIFGGPINRVSTGTNVKLVNTLLNVSSGTINIGDHSFFGHNVMLLTGSHPTHKMEADRQEFPDSGRDIQIGQGVWIASGAIVLGPCVIEDNVVIGAGSVVCGGRLQKGYLYAGAPARPIKKLTP